MIYEMKTTMSSRFLLLLVYVLFVNFVVVSDVDAVLRIVNATYGDNGIISLGYNDAIPTTTPSANLLYTHVSTDFFECGGGPCVRLNIIENIAYTTAVLPTAPGVIGREVTFRDIVVGPRAKSTPQTNMAFDVNSLAVDSVTAAQQFGLFQICWYLSFNDPLCAARGCNFMLCRGPLYVQSDNTDPFIQDPATINYTDAQFLFARGFYLAGRAGHLAQIKTVTEVQIVQNSLSVQTNCFYPPSNNASFSALYNCQLLDAVDGTYTSISLSCGRQDDLLQLRVILERTTSYSTDFTLYFAAATGFGTSPQTYFQFYWASFLQLSSFSNPNGVLFAFEDVFGETIDFYSIQTTGETCSAIFTVTPALRPPVMVPWSIPSILNAFTGIIKSRFGTSRHNNYHIGSLTPTNQLTYPGCPDSGKCGGDTIGWTDTNPSYQAFVPPDAKWAGAAPDTQSYLLYPSADAFQGFGLGIPGYGGGTYQRLSPLTQGTYTPLVWATPILNADSDVGTLDERGKQCSMYNAGNSRCVGPVCDACQQDPQYACFAANSVPFQNGCLYRPSSTRDAQLAGPLSDAASKIPNIAAFTALFGSNAQSYVTTLANPDGYQLQWLLLNYITAFCDPAATVRFSQTSSNGIVTCVCMSCSWNGDGSSSGSSTPCACETSRDNFGNLVFSAFMYNFESYVPFGWFNSVGPLEQLILREGQPGVNITGASWRIIYAPGWGGSFGTVWTCPIGSDGTISGAILSTGAQIQQYFYQQCAVNGGTCFDGNVLICGCPDFTGPVGSLLPNFYANATVNLTAIASMCQCPAVQRDGETAQAQVFGVQGYYSGQLICDSDTHGVCEQDYGLNQAYCRSVQRYNTNPFINAYEDAYQGYSTGCPVSVVYDPQNGFMNNPPGGSTGMCNGFGVCCADSVQHPECVDVFGNNQPDDCACPNGRAGRSCSCVAAFDFTENDTLLDVTPLAPDSRFDAGAFVQVSIASPQQIVRVAVVHARANANIDVFSSCTPLAVALVDSNACLTCDPFVFCVETPLILGQDRRITRFACNGTSSFADGVFASAIAVWTLESSPMCEILSFSETWSVCGPPDQINSYAGLFYLNEFRVFGNGTTIDYQFDELAHQACTLTDCLCSPNFDGQTCGVGTSAMHDTETRQVCGIEQGRGQPVNEDEYYGGVGGGGAGSNGNLGQECQCLPMYSQDGQDANVGNYGPWAGKACECGNFTSGDVGFQTICGSHGSCRSTNFDWGRCSYDLANWLVDPLYTPFFVVWGSVPAFWGTSSTLATWEDVGETVFSILGIGSFAISSDVLVSFTGFISPTSSFVSPSSSPTSTTSTPSSSSPSKSPTINTDVVDIIATEAMSTSPVFLTSSTIQATSVVFIRVLLNGSTETCDPALSGSCKYPSSPCATDGAPAPSTLPRLGNDPIAQICITEATAVTSSVIKTITLPSDTFLYLAEGSLKTTPSVPPLLPGITVPPLECNDPLQRWWDWAISQIFGLTPSQTSCGQLPMTYFGNDVGTLFGIFDQTFPPLNFWLSPLNWGIAEWTFLGSLSNGIWYTDTYGNDVSWPLINSTSIAAYARGVVAEIINNNARTLMVDDTLDTNFPYIQWDIIQDRPYAASKLIPGIIQRFNLTSEKSIVNVTITFPLAINRATVFGIMTLPNNTENSTHVPPSPLAMDSLINCGTAWNVVGSSKLTFDCSCIYPCSDFVLDTEPAKLYLTISESNTQVSRFTNYAEWTLEDFENQAPEVTNLEDYIVSVPDVVVFSQRTTLFQLAREFSELVNTELILPPNQQLRNDVVSYQNAPAPLGGQLIPVTLDYENPIHQQKLWTRFGTWLGARRCAVDQDCTFESRLPNAPIGNVTCSRLLSPYPFVPFRSGPFFEPSGSVFPMTTTFPGDFGNEGGCACPPTFRAGLWNSSTVCGTCVDGYGPAIGIDIENTFQYQAALQTSFPGNPNTTILNTTAFPWNAFRTPEYELGLGAAAYDLEVLNSSILCRLPMAFDLVCGGNGMLMNDTTSTTVEIPLWWIDETGKNPAATPTCLSLFVDGTRLNATEVQDPRVQVFVGPQGTGLGISVFQLPTFQGVFLNRNGFQEELELIDCPRNMGLSSGASWNCDFQGVTTGSSYQVTCDNPGLFPMLDDALNMVSLTSVEVISGQWTSWITQLG